MEQLGIKETKELVLFVLRLLSAGDHALADGKIDFTDLGDLFGPLQSAKAAFADTNMIPKELGDLSADETAEIMKMIDVELELRNVNAKDIVRDVVSLAGQVAVILSKYKKMKVVSEG